MNTHLITETPQSNQMRVKSILIAPALEIFVCTNKSPSQSPLNLTGPAPSLCAFTVETLCVLMIPSNNVDFFSII